MSKKSKKGLMQQLFPVEGKTVPQLRFPEFRDKGKWVQGKIESICGNIFSGGTPASTNKQYYGGGIPFIRSGEIAATKATLFLTKEGLANSSAKMVKFGDVLVALYGANSGDVALGKIEGAINQAVLCLRTKGNNAFLFQYLTHRKQEITSKYLQGGQGNLSGDIIKSIEFFFPTKDEQQKIADCLSSIDDLITAQAQKIESLKDHKKGLMQQLFPAEGETVPQLRFPEFRDAREWDVKPFGDGFKRLTTKNSENNQNPLTISAQLGLVSQLEYFNKKIAANNLSGYYLLHKGDFAYNKSYSKGYPIGAIKPLRLYDKGVVSTLYICFRTKKGYNEYFYEHYFESGLLDPEIGKIAQEGGRAHGLLNVSVKEFFKDVNIYVPWPNEQQKIADCLSSLDNLITAQAKKIESLKDHKKGLMQQLFPVDN